MKFLISGLVLLFSISNLCALDPSSSDDALVKEKSILIEESNFQKLGLEMKKKSLGLVLMLHAEQCPYCALMESEILAPMVKSGEYDKKVVIRKLQIDDRREVIDFSGAVVAPSDISGKYNATLTPTLVFLDSQGHQKIDNMIGINTVELFGAYLDIEIDKLVDSIKQ